METNNELTTNDFDELNFENKLKTVYNTGEFIDSHITSIGESQIINFYNFNQFQVEVVYDLVGTSVKAINCINLRTELNHFESEISAAS